jgi:transcriptional regulator with XRE-family HTH domain
MSDLKLYKSYNFVDKDPVIDWMRGIVKGMKYSEIMARSGVSSSTLHNWFEGNTKRPQYATVMAVTRALGYKQTFIEMGKKSESRAAASSSNTKGVVRRAQG